MYHPVPCFLFIPFFLARARGDRCPRQEEYRGGGGGGARGVFSSARERAKRRRRRRRGRGRVRITDGCWPAGLGATVLIMMGQAGDSCHLLWAVQKGTNCKGTRWLSLSLSLSLVELLARLPTQKLNFKRALCGQFSVFPLCKPCHRSHGF